MAIIVEQAESRGLSAFIRLCLQSCPQVQSGRGAPVTKTPHPQKHACKARGTECVISPAHIPRGVAGCPR
jgi:hypothetical protein